MCANQSCPRCESQSFRRECNLSNPCVPGRTCIETSMHMRTTVGLTLMRSEGPLTNTTHCKSAPRTKGRHNSKTPDFDASFLKNVCGTILSFILKAEKCACTIPSTSVDRLEEQATKGNQTKHKSQSKILKSSSFEAGLGTQSEPTREDVTAEILENNEAMNQASCMVLDHITNALGTNPGNRFQK